MRFFNSNSLTTALGLTAFLGSFFVASLSTKAKNEIMLATADGMVRPTDKLFKEMLNGPRKHSLLVQFTVLGGSFDCKICHIVNEVMKEASKAVHKSTHNEDVYLVTLDYATSSKIFQKYKITSAPILYLFPATEKATESPEFLEFKGVGPNLEADTIIRYIHENLGIKIPYSKPINYQKLGINLATGAFIIFIVYMAFSQFSIIAYSTKFWASFSIMWNSIRGSSYMNHNRDGTVEWFAGGFQEQYGFESQVVAGVYGIATFALVLLGTHAPKIKTPLLQSIVSIFLMAVFVACLSFITALFKRKFSPYPYKIFFQ